jgi:hypothetical protein
VSYSDIGQGKIKTGGNDGRWDSSGMVSRMVERDDSHWFTDMKITKTVHALMNARFLLNNRDYCQYTSKTSASLKSHTHELKKSNPAKK